MENFKRRDHLIETACEDVNQAEMAQNSDQWWASVKLQVFIKGVNFLINWTSDSQGRPSILFAMKCV